MDEQERYSRQKDLVPINELKDTKITVIGVGAVGRQVSLQLAAMGAQQLHLIDFDKVEESNVASQGYWEGDIGQYKVDATLRHCYMINGSINAKPDIDRFRKKTKVGDVVFCCVDNMDTRKLIFDSVKHRVKLFIDGRMSAEVFRVLAAYDDKSKNYYEVQTLFPASEAQQGSCTAKSTIYCANGLACFETQILAKWLRGFPLQADVLMNLLTNELTILKE